MIIKRQNRWLSAGLVLMFSVGCNSGSGGGSSGGSDDADVAGRWVTTIENPNIATFNGCSGDLGAFEGLTYSDLVAGVTCTFLDDMLVEQSGDDLSAPAIDISCDNGVNQTLFMSGSVNGDEVEVILRTVGDNGITAIDTLLGTADGNQIDFEESRFTLSGNMNGACLVTPPLRLTVRIF